MVGPTLSGFKLVGQPDFILSGQSGANKRPQLPVLVPVIVFLQFWHKPCDAANLLLWRRNPEMTFLSFEILITSSSIHFIIYYNFFIVFLLFYDSCQLFHILLFPLTFISESPLLSFIYFSSLLKYSRH